MTGGCADGDGEPATTEGSIELAVEGWSGVEGYRLLALTWDAKGELMGGSFWAMVGDDPFTVSDTVHPPYEGDEEAPEGEGWGAGDYVWDERVRFEPGTYRVEFYAHPGEIPPYGSHIPASPVERRCETQVEVVAGEIATVTISGIRGGTPEGSCPLA